jgi:hypothetical protein
MNITIKVFAFMAATAAAFVAGKTTPRAGIVIPLTDYVEIESAEK